MSLIPELIIPNGWAPRPYQHKFWSSLERDIKRAIVIAHRRWGKDDVMLHNAAVKVLERPGTYWHCLPEYAQARRAIWNAVNAHTGKRRIDEAFPHWMRKRTNDQEMFIEFVNGSTWQVIGSDNYNRLVGAGVAGVTFSEYALANPDAWGYIKPMIEETNGWATFITTPRGNNHAKQLLDYAQGRADWYSEISDVHSSKALAHEKLKEILEEYEAIFGVDIGRAQYEQEYECSFNAAILGAFYAREMRAVRKEGRVLNDLEPVPGRPVHRAWDIGVKDDTSIWWFQVVGQQVYVLDCYSTNGAGLDHYVEYIGNLHQERGWMSGVDFVPHDARVKEFGTGKTRVESMQEFGLKPQVVPMASKLDGINAVRRTLPLCVFSDRCDKAGLPALENYRREWDSDKKTFKASEVHDWSSHPADAFRYLAMAWRPNMADQDSRRTAVPQRVQINPSVLSEGIVAPPLRMKRR